MPYIIFKDVLAKAAGGVLPVVLPPMHILTLYYFWGEFGRRVNKQYCSCSCWDTIFKGTYESGIASYKHIYFNATANTTKIWVVTAVCIILLYECCKHLLTLVFDGRGRYVMCLLFTSSLFAHYYAWWVYVNYWNDDFYGQWNHQLFFTITELCSTALVVHLANNRNIVNSKKVVTIIAIAIVHIFASGVDQFLMNVLLGKGQAHQVVRDLAFMIPDLCHVIFPYLEMRTNNVRFNGPQDLALFTIIVVLGCCLSFIL